MIKTNHLLILLLSAIFASGLAPKETIDLTNYRRETYDSVVKLKVGQSLEVLLKENPTTGYIWQVLDSLLEKEGVK
jgi:hypothetical protein